MSLIGTVGSAVLSGVLSKFASSGGSGNVANNLSQRLGCTILQKDAQAAMAAENRGINPCTGQPKFPIPTLMNIPKSIGPGFGSVPGFVAAPTGGMSSLPTIARGVGGLIRTTTGRVSKIILPSGATFSRAKAAALIRRVGFEAAAVALGITLIEAAEILLTQSQAGRRKRGITGSQLATTKRTICSLRRMMRDLNITKAPARRSSCR